jgi:pimeloyl-ACP methyl ester carboxylesterase
MPDLRGHGPAPLVATTSFGGCEIEDTLAAVDFLKKLKTKKQKSVVGNSIGLYGTELGGLVALSTAARLSNVKAIAIDSVPLYSDDVMASAINLKYPFASFITAEIAKGGSYLYFATGCYERKSVCDTAASIEGRQVLLLAGMDAPALRTSTSQVSGCFPNNSKVTAFTDLVPSGLNISGASLENAESYEQKVIYFFKAALEDKEQESEPEVLAPAPDQVAMDDASPSESPKPESDIVVSSPSKRESAE